MDPLDEDFWRAMIVLLIWHHLGWGIFIIDISETER